MIPRGVAAGRFSKLKAEMRGACGWGMHHLGQVLPTNLTASLYPYPAPCYCSIIECSHV